MAEAAQRKIFLSYRREDSKYVTGRLYDRLADHFGSENVFMDIDSIELGRDFGEAIGNAVGQCDILLAMIGPHWLTSVDANGLRRLDNPDDYVVLEISAALERGIRVIPLLVDEAKVPPADQLPKKLTQLTRRNSFRIVHEMFKASVGNLIERLDEIFRRIADEQVESSDSLQADPQSSAHQAAELKIESALDPISCPNLRQGEGNIAAATIRAEPGESLTTDVALQANPESASTDASDTVRPLSFETTLSEGEAIIPHQLASNLQDGRSRAGPEQAAFEVAFNERAEARSELGDWAQTAKPSTAIDGDTQPIKILATESHAPAIDGKSSPLPATTPSSPPPPSTTLEAGFYSGLVDDLLDRTRSWVLRPATPTAALRLVVATGPIALLSFLLLGAVWVAVLNDPAGPLALSFPKILTGLFGFVLGSAIFAAIAGAVGFAVTGGFLLLGARRSGLRVDEHVPRMVGFGAAGFCAFVVWLESTGGAVWILYNQRVSHADEYGWAGSLVVVAVALSGWLSFVAWEMLYERSVRRSRRPADRYFSLLVGLCALLLVSCVVATDAGVQLFGGARWVLYISSWATLALCAMALVVEAFD